jgi:Ca2+-binding RTX toxin-like protein
MSEVSVANGTVTGFGFSLRVESEEPVLFDLPDAPGDPLIITGTDSDDTIIVDPSSTASITFIGGDGFDNYDASSGSEYLYGGADDDFLAGGGGRDFLSGGEDDDVLYGEAGNDRISGDSGDDVLVGGTGDDFLWGGIGNDRLIGGSGNDTLIGGRGKDVLIGGSGKDIFIFRAEHTGGDKLDKIKDFKPADDIIRLSKALLPGSRLGNGNLTAADFASVTEINETVTAKVVYEETSGILYYNPKNGVEVPLLQLPKELSGISADNIEIS